MKPVEHRCGDLKDQLSDFLDGELDDEVCQEIRRHLATCDNCRIMVDTLRKTIMLYREAPHDAVPEGTHQRLIRVLQLEELKNLARGKLDESNSQDSSCD